MTYRRLKIKDIASGLKESGSNISNATISRVLNGHPDVSPSTRETVLQYIRDHSSDINRSARGPSGGRTSLIGLTTPYLAGEYFARIVAGAAEALFERDARLVVCPTHHEYSREISLLERLKHGVVDGALLILPSESEQELASVRDQGFPIVIIDPAQPVGASVPVVSTANLTGAQRITEYLIKKGHKRIGVITGQMHRVTSQQRLDGYLLALAKAELPYIPDLVCQINAEGEPNRFGFEDGKYGAKQLLDRPDRPTAIFAFNDPMAIGAMHAVWDKGLSVPEHISVVGFDDVEIAGATRPGLTTVRQPLQELGPVAVDLLYRLIAGHTLDKMRVELSTEIIQRGSVADIRS